MHAFVLFLFTQRSFFLFLVQQPVNWESQAFMRATGILWQLKDGGRNNWVLKCRTVEPPVSDHPQREYNYSQTQL